MFESNPKAWAQRTGVDPESWTLVRDTRPEFHARTGSLSRRGSDRAVAHALLRYRRNLVEFPLGLLRAAGFIVQEATLLSRHGARATVGVVNELLFRGSMLQRPRENSDQQTVPGSI